MAPLLYLRRCWLAYFFLLFTMPSTVSLLSCRGILISFFLFTQILMDLTAYALPERCNSGTTHIFDTFVINRVPYGVSMAKKSKCAILLHLSNLRKKIHCTVLGAVLAVSDVLSALIHPIIFHGNRFWLVHIYLYQVPFNMCRPFIFLIDEKSLSFEVSISLLIGLSAIW